MDRCAIVVTIKRVRSFDIEEEQHSMHDAEDGEEEEG